MNTGLETRPFMAVPFPISRLQSHSQSRGCSPIPNLEVAGLTLIFLSSLMTSSGRVGGLGEGGRRRLAWAVVSRVLAARSSLQSGEGSRIHAGRRAGWIIATHGALQGVSEYGALQLVSEYGGCHT